MRPLSVIPDATRALVDPGHLDFILAPCCCGAGCPMDAPFRHTLEVLLRRLDDVRHHATQPRLARQALSPTPRSAEDATEALIVAFFAALAASGEEALVRWPELLRGLLRGLPDRNTPPPVRLLHRAIRQQTPQAPGRWKRALHRLQPDPAWQPHLETCSSARIDLLCDALAA